VFVISGHHGTLDTHSMATDGPSLMSLGGWMGPLLRSCCLQETLCETQTRDPACPSAPFIQPFMRFAASWCRLLKQYCVACTNQQGRLTELNRKCSNSHDHLVTPQGSAKRPFLMTKKTTSDET